METSKSTLSLLATFRWIDDNKLWWSFGLVGLFIWSVVNRGPKIWKCVISPMWCWLLASRVMVAMVFVCEKVIVSNVLSKMNFCCTSYGVDTNFISSYPFWFLLSQHLGKAFLCSGGLLASWKFGLSKSRQISEKAVSENLQTEHLVDCTSTFARDLSTEFHLQFHFLRLKTPLKSFDALPLIHFRKVPNMMKQCAGFKAVENGWKIPWQFQPWVWCEFAPLWQKRKFHWMSLKHRRYLHIPWWQVRDIATLHQGAGGFGSRR